LLKLYVKKLITILYVSVGDVASPKHVI